MSRTRHHGDKRKAELLGGDWKWHNRDPKQWRHLHKHKPQRAKARKALHDVVSGEEGVEFPLDKKPRIYFW